MSRSLTNCIKGCIKECVAVTVPNLLLNNMLLIGFRVYAFWQKLESQWQSCQLEGLPVTATVQKGQSNVSILEETQVADYHACYVELAKLLESSAELSGLYFTCVYIHARVLCSALHLLNYRLDFVAM